MGMKPPRVQPPPVLMKKPEAPKKPVEVTKKPSRNVGTGKTKRRRGTARDTLVSRRPTTPTGVNNSSGGAGVYG